MRTIVLSFAIFLGLAASLYSDGYLFSASVGPSVYTNYNFIKTGTYQYETQELQTTAAATVDIPWALLAAEYSFGFIDYLGKVYDATGNTNQLLSNSFNATIDGSRRSELRISLLAKYPFTIGKAVLTPLFGAQFALNLSYFRDGTDMRASMTEEQLADLNEWYLVGGAGLRFPLSELFLLTADVWYGYGLTASPTTPTAGYAYEASFIRYSLGLCLQFR